MVKFSSLRSENTILANRVALQSSKWGKVCTLIGATFVLRHDARFVTTEKSIVGAGLKKNASMLAFQRKPRVLAVLASDNFRNWESNRPLSFEVHFRREKPADFRT